MTEQQEEEAACTSCYRTVVYLCYSEDGKNTCGEKGSLCLSLQHTALYQSVILERNPHFTQRKREKGSDCSLFVENVVPVLRKARGRQSDRQKVKRGSEPAAVVIEMRREKEIS